MNSDLAVPWSPTFVELGGEYIRLDRHNGQQSWYVRGQNLVAVVTWAVDGEVLHDPAAPDEHVILVPEAGMAEVRHENGDHVVAAGPALVIAPAGEVSVTVQRTGFVLRIFTARGEVAARAVNRSTYTAGNERVAPLPDTPICVGPGRLRVHPVVEGPEPGSRVYRSDSLLVDWWSPQDGPASTDGLSLHLDDDVERASITLDGDHVHHVRRPWTGRMRDWRPDEHVQVASPSVTLVPPGNLHTARAVGPGRHQLIDVVAPPRFDLVEQGQVLNRTEYENTRDET